MRIQQYNKESNEYRKLKKEEILSLIHISFRPVKVENVQDHHMHSEFFRIEPEEAEKINRAKEGGHRVISVGTTSCRTLESAADENGHIDAKSGWTEIFIYPGYKFKCIDALITNFHLPQSTLLMLGAVPKVDEV